ncbi:MAG: hypothetical protein ACYCVV_20100 [Acidimicrobiales bacterium]
MDEGRARTGQAAKGERLSGARLSNGQHVVKPRGVRGTGIIACPLGWPVLIARHDGLQHLATTRRLSRLVVSVRRP